MRMSPKSSVPGPASRSAGVTPPVYASTRIPAARAAATPCALSSITVQRAGSTPIVAAAWRNTSGSGLPRATSCVLKMRSSAKWWRSPVRSSERRMLACLLLDATQIGSVGWSRASRSSTSAMPSIATSSVDERLLVERRELGLPVRARACGRPGPRSRRP